MEELAGIGAVEAAAGRGALASSKEEDRVFDTK